MVTLNNTSLTYTAVESARGNSSFTYRTCQFIFFIHISRNYKVLLSSCPHLWKSTCKVKFTNRHGMLCTAHY